MCTLLIKNKRDAQTLYDQSLSYKTIIDWLQQQNEQRADFCADVLAIALDKTKVAWVRDDTVPAYADFWDAYQQYVHQQYPQLTLRPKQSGPTTEKQGWVKFTHAGRDYDARKTTAR